VANTNVRRLATALNTPSTAKPAGSPPKLDLRQGVVTFVDYTNVWAYVQLASDVDAGYSIPRCRWIGPYMPAVDDVVWCTKNDSELMMLGEQNPEVGFARQTFDFSGDVTHAPGAGSAYINYSFDVARPSIIRLDFRASVRASTTGTVFASITVEQPSASSVRVFNTEGTGTPPPTQTLNGWWEWYQQPATGVTLNVIKANGGSSGSGAIFSRFLSDIWIRRVG